MDTKRSKLIQLVLAAVLAAFACVATMVIQIPSPMNGYINLGDCIVLLCGWLLGPMYGFFAAGIGSMLADIFSGYAYYAPGTFVIKGLVALIAALPLLAVKNASSPKQFTLRILGGLLGEAVMVLGYFGYACLLLGKGLAAASSIPGNLVQGAVGLIGAAIVYELLLRSKVTEKLCKAN